MIIGKRTWLATKIGLILIASLCCCLIGFYFGRESLDYCEITDNITKEKAIEMLQYCRYTHIAYIEEHDKIGYILAEDGGRAYQIGIIQKYDKLINFVENNTQ